MRVQLHILPGLVQPTDNGAHFVPPGISSAHVHKKNMFDAEFIAHSAHFTHAGSAVFMFAPNETADMIRHSTFGEGFGVDCNDGIFICRHQYIFPIELVRIPC